MATSFPILRTSAIAQYPATRNIRYQNQMLWFVDGTRQRYRDASGPLHRWVIQLDQLEEGEMAALERFFQDNEGCAGNFAFTDPWSGAVYPNCSFSEDEIELDTLAELKGRTSFTVQENRG
jgi:hypothetical protein